MKMEEGVGIGADGIVECAVARDGGGDLGDGGADFGTTGGIAFEAGFEEGAFVGIEEGFEDLIDGLVSAFGVTDGIGEDALFFTR